MITPSPLPLLNLDRQKPKPLYLQIYDELRLAILAGRLYAGMRLPSSRDMAATLHVSRNTVKNAYEQLIAEGYLDAETGSGTYVTRLIPDELLGVRNVDANRNGTPSSKMQAAASRPVSKLGAALRPVGCEIRQIADGHVSSPFAIGTPALDLFPIDVWGRIASSVHKRTLPHHLYSAQDPMGYRPLREALADHLRAARGVRCDAEHILIVSGSQMGLYITARALLNAGDGVWLEEPGYIGAQAVARILRADLSLVPVDGEGLNVEKGTKLNQDARLAFVTPSHQFPLGHTMSLPRRLQLLHWAEEAGGWIVEDDYDSEFRYGGRPIAALQGLDTNDRVIYSGTLSKVLFPALRLAYLILPDDLVDLFVGIKTQIDTNTSIAHQITAAEFMLQGHFARHIRLMLAEYTERRNALVNTIERELAGALALGPAECGMHVMGWLADGLNEQKIVQQAAKVGIALGGLSRHYLGTEKEAGLLFGFTNAPPEALVGGVRVLGEIIYRDSVRSTPENENRA